MNRDDNKKLVSLPVMGYSSLTVDFHESFRLSSRPPRVLLRISRDLESVIVRFQRVACKSRLVSVSDAHFSKRRVAFVLRMGVMISVADGWADSLSIL